MTDTKQMAVDCWALNRGQVVEVRSKESIAQSLDAARKRDGCLFMDQMWNYCGESYKIRKVVTHVFDEQKYRMHRTRVPLYLLEGVICEGAGDLNGPQCDKSCYLLWHPAWLILTEGLGSGR